MLHVARHSRKDDDGAKSSSPLLVLVKTLHRAKLEKSSGDDGDDDDDDDDDAEDEGESFRMHISKSNSKGVAAVALASITDELQAIEWAVAALGSLVGGAEAASVTSSSSSSSSAGSIAKGAMMIESSIGSAAEREQTLPIGVRYELVYTRLQ